MAYTNSPLVNSVIKSPNHSGTRNHKIDRITPHCVVGQLSAEAVANSFLPKEKEVSANYIIGTDGGVCLCVDEANRSWCSSSSENDNRAVTIEVASDATEPYAFNNVAYNKLIELCIDICKRNNLNKVLWFSDKATALNYQPKDGECVLTVHRWFANKSCPGNWMFARMGELADAINKALTPPSSYPAVPFLVQVTDNELNYRSGPSYNDKILGQTGKGSFTIVEVQGDWGKLKSGIGWINLTIDCCKILGAATASKTPSNASNSAASNASQSASSAPAATTTIKKTATGIATNRDNSLAGIYKTTGNLNIRNAAGLDKALMVTIPYGHEVQNFGYYSMSGGVKWLYVQFVYKNVTYVGFASSQYLRKK